MRPEPGGTCYEYIAVYVDDLAIAAKDPQAFCNELKKKYNLKLKGVGPLEYHLGCTYKKDPDGTLAADPRRYVNKILESYERMFNEKPRKSRPPLEGGDHPELDTSELCDDHQTKQFQTLIGQLQWLISLGHFDIAVHVMSLSRLTEVWILQGICPLKDEWVFGCSLKTRLADQTKTQQLKWLWSNDTKDSTINQRLVEQIQEETLSWKVVEVLPW